MENTPSILIIDDEESMRRFLTVLLEKEGYRVISSTTGRAALQVLESDPIDAVITDLKMPDMDGIEVLEAIKGRWPQVPVVILTAHASVTSAIQAVNKGAFQYIEKKAKNDEIALVVKNALSMGRLQSENQVLKRQLRQSHSRSEDHREVRGDDEGLQDDREGRGHRGDHARLRRDRDGKGADRPRDPLSVAPRTGPVRLDQLRRSAEGPARVEPLRPREGIVHGSGSRSARAIHRQ